MFINSHPCEAGMGKRANNKPPHFLMRELRAQVTLPGEPEAAELSQGQSLERSPEPGWALQHPRSHSRNMFHCPGQTTIQPSIGLSLVLCRASCIPGHLDCAENTFTVANDPPLPPTSKELLKCIPKNCQGTKCGLCIS